MIIISTQNQKCMAVYLHAAEIAQRNVKNDVPSALTVVVKRLPNGIDPNTYITLRHHLHITYYILHITYLHHTNAIVFIILVVI